MNEKQKEQFKYREKFQYKAQTRAAMNTATTCQCTFCGAELEEDERFCSECGNPRDGIRCPKCGTINHRSFCSHCNTPLNELAKEAVAQAKSDPLFHRAEKLAAELAELEKQIIVAPDVPAATLDRSVRNETRQEASRYASLFKGVSSLKVPDAPMLEKMAPSKVVTQDLLAKAQEAYRQKAAELQSTMDAMLPPASATPEEKRNFFCARLILTVNWETTSQVWKCNYCGALHHAPSECVQPELGGKWIITSFSKGSMRPSTVFD